MSRLMFATLVAVTAMSCGPPRAGLAQDANASFRFVPPEAVAAIVAYPKRAFDSPGAALYPREVISAAGLKELGIDPIEIEQFVAFFESPNDDNGQTPFGVVLKMSKPQDIKNILRTTIPGLGPPQMKNGRPYVPAPAAYLPAIYLANDRTIVVAPETVLDKMLANKGGDSPLLKLLRAAPQDREIMVFATLDPIRDQIRGVLAEAPPTPPPFDQFLKLPEHVSSLEIHANLISGSTDLQVHFNATNGSSAEAVEQLLKSAVGMAREFIVAQAAQNMRGIDPVEVAMGQYMQRMVDHFAKMLAPKRQGNRVTVAAKIDAGMATNGIMIGLLLPAVQAARAAAQRASASNNLKQIALAMHNYHDSFGGLPTAAITDKTGKPLLSWRVAVLPFIEQGPLYEQFKLDEPWDSEHNRKLIDKMPQIYLSPGGQKNGTTRYQVPTGGQAMFGDNRKTRFADVTDGLSNTIMVVETAPDRAVVWTKPDDFKVDFAKPHDGLVNPQATFFQAALGDGSVRVIAANIAAETLKALFTRNGAEVIRNF